MFFVRTVGEAGEKTYGIANIKAAYYVGKDKYTKNFSIRETFLRNNFLCFGRLLRWTLESHQAVGNSRLNGNGRGTVVFVGRRGIPSMCLEDTINVGLAAQLDIISSLEDVNTVVSLVKTTFSFNAHSSIFGLDVFADLITRARLSSVRHQAWQLHSMSKRGDRCRRKCTGRSFFSSWCC